MLRPTHSSLVFLSALAGCSGSSGPSDTSAAHDNYDFANRGILTVNALEGVLSNDQGEGLVAELLLGPAISEAFVLNGDGSFSYTANTDSLKVFTDQFEYQVTGKDGLTASALATLNVYPEPIAVGDEYRVSVGEANHITSEKGVLINDQLERHESAAQVGRLPAKAESFVLSPDGSFSYSPKSGANGVDSFTYFVVDDLQSSEEQVVELVIDTGVLSGQNDSFRIESGKILQLSPLQGLLKNDDGLEGVSVVVQKLPLHAIDFSVSTRGLLIYRTVSEAAEQDSFSYTLHKNKQIIGPFDVNIEITPPTDSTLAPSLYDQCTEYQAGSNVDGLLLGLGIEGATFERVSSPRFGVLTSFDGVSGQYSYTRQSSNRGQDAFSYRIFDANGGYVADASQELIAVPYRIMPVGDSITSGVELYDANINADTPTPAKRVGYRKFLKDELSSLGYSIDLIGSRNEGYTVSGFTDTQHNGFPGVSDDFVSNNIEQWLDTTGADIILMHIGTNGTKTHLNYIKSIGTKIENWEEREDNPITWMMAKLIARTDTTGGSQAILRFNNLTEAYVAERMAAGDRIHLVDQYTALGGGGYLSADKLHPRIEGYQIMSNEWIKRLQETQAIAKCI